MKTLYTITLKYSDRSDEYSEMYSSDYTGDHFLELTFNQRKIRPVRDTYVVEEGFAGAAYTMKAESALSKHSCAKLEDWCRPYHVGRLDSTFDPEWYTQRYPEATKLWKDSLDRDETMVLRRHFIENTSVHKL